MSAISANYEKLQKSALKTNLSILAVVRNKSSSTNALRKSIPTLNAAALPRMASPCRVMRATHMIFEGTGNVMTKRQPQVDKADAGAKE
jgi:hypothetical protein